MRHLSTKIDSILTYNIFHENKSGLLIIDITDHLPKFTLCPYEVKGNPMEIFIHKRRNDEESTKKA